MDVNLFDSLIIILTIAVVVIVLCKYIKVPPTIGYIVIGVLVGPHAAGWIPNTQDIYKLAEFGVVFLMFTIGLEFSLSRLINMRHLVFGLGGAQVLITAFLMTITGHFLGMTWEQAIIVGCIVSMSSTAIVSKQLSEQNELHAPHGYHAISILLFQDLAVIPFFILISSFAQKDLAIDVSLLMALGNTVIAITVILLLGRWLFRPLFREIVSMESLELFTLSVFLVALMAAWLTHRVGLSLAFGAFMAGIMLGETEFRHQIEATIRPFRDILLGLFFITVGMLFNIRVIAEIWPWVLLLFAALTLFKVVLITGLSLVADRTKKVALRTGLVLAQGGEFGFALLSLAIANTLLPDLYGQVVLGALVFSMGVSPLIIHFNDRIATFLLPKKWGALEQEPLTEEALFVKALRQHVVICGFGRSGQSIAKLLDDEGIRYVAIDSDHQLVNNSQAAGLPVIYGDAGLYDILESCKIRSAKAAVITFENMATTEKILQQIRSHHEKLPIFVRTHDDTTLEKLQEMGATEVIPSSLETSLTIASHLLLTMDVSAARIASLMNKIRKTRYRLLREIIPGEEEID